MWTRERSGKERRGAAEFAWKGRKKSFFTRLKHRTCKLFKKKKINTKKESYWQQKRYSFQRTNNITKKPIRDEKVHSPKYFSHITGKYNACEESTVFKILATLQGNMLATKRYSLQRTRNSYII